MAGRPRNLPLRLAGLVPHYARTAWQGLVAPRLPGPPHEVAQGAVFAEGRVLLTVRADLRGWELPGGRIDPGETPEQAVVRELREETGLDVEIERRVGRYRREGFLPHTAHVFRCRPRAGQMTTSHETARVEWWPLDGLPTTLFPWYRQPLEDALPAEAPPAERTERLGLAEIAAGMRIDLRMRLSADRAV